MQISDTQPVWSLLKINNPLSGRKPSKGAKFESKHGIMENKQQPSRRQFLIDTGKAGLGAAIGVHTLSSFASVKKEGWVMEPGWMQQPLGYAYNSIEPAVDAMTMEIHYTKHAAAYAKNLADAAKDEKVDVDKTSLRTLFSHISKYSAKMRNNGGGHYNHELFWRSLRPPVTGNAPKGEFAAQINQDLGSFEAFQQKFTDAAKNRFGSGWAWLVWTPENKLVVSSTPNQDNPLMDIAEVKGIPVLGLDVWEHAYYLKYQNRRPDYIAAWWSAVNWEFVSNRFESIV